MGPIDSPTPLTLPLVAPPLPDVDGLYAKGTGLIVVRRLAHSLSFRNEASTSSCRERSGKRSAFIDVEISV